jgi:hypothetical protein
MEGFDLIEQLNESVAVRLRDLGGFSQPPAIDVLTERLSDLENRIQIGVAKIGMCIVLSTPVIKLGLSTNHLVGKVSVMVNENIVINQARSGSRIKASSAALRCYFALIGFQPDGGWSPLVPDPEADPIQLIKVQTNDSPILSYEVNLRTEIVVTASVEELPALSGTP